MFYVFVPVNCNTFCIYITEKMKSIIIIIIIIEHYSGSLFIKGLKPSYCSLIYSLFHSLFDRLFYSL